MTIKSNTIARTIILILALINQILAIFGKETIPFTEHNIYQAVSIIVTVLSTLWAWWKNNSFTKAALKADEYLKSIKEEANE